MSEPVMTQQPAALATPEETLVVFQKVDKMLAVGAERLTGVALSGPLNAEQHLNLVFVRQILQGLQKLFAAESERIAAASVQTRES